MAFLGFFLIFRPENGPKKGKNQKSVPNIFSDMFLSRSQPIFSSNGQFGLKLLRANAAKDQKYGMMGVFRNFSC